MSQKAVFISGAGSGIGEATAIRLDKLGYKVFAGVISEFQANHIKEQCSDSVTTIIIDITKQDSVDAAVKQITQDVGEQGLYGLFNNAGIGIGMPLEVAPLSYVQKIMDTNFMGHVRVTQGLLPLIRKGHGRIINTISICGFVPVNGLGPYCASKHAMEGFTSVLHLELSPWNIPVIGIEPAAINTPIFLHAEADMERIRAGMSKTDLLHYSDYFSERRRERGREELQKNGVSPDEVAKAVEHALEAKKPKLRYRVGKGASLLNAFYRLLPIKAYYRSIKLIFKV